MSVDSVLDSAFTTLLAKARQRADELARPSPRPATLNFGWGGGGVALTAATADPILLEVPWPGEIRWAHMYAGDANGVPVAVTATISVQITRLTTFGGVLPLHGTAIPTLTAAAAADLVVTTWVQNLLPGDALIGRLETFEGDATWISLNLLLYPTSDDLGSAELLSSDGDELTDADGNIVVLRS
jgi:hypothetical protein